MPKKNQFPHTFGKQLKHIVSAIDKLTKDRLDDIMQITKRYVVDHLGEMEDIIIAMQYPKGKDTFLLKVWPPTRPGSLPDPDQDLSWDKPAVVDGKPVGQSSLVLINKEKKSGWFVNRTKTSLKNNAEYVDLAENYSSDDIPMFLPALDNDPITSIIFPLWLNDQKLGIVNFELTEYVEHNKDWERELKNIADALAILFKLYEIHDVQESTSKNSIEALREEYYIPPKGKNTAVFFSSANSPGDIVEVIKNTITSKKYNFALKDWKDGTQLDIVSEIKDNAKSATVGIAYVSELNNDGKGHRDNGNVLIEIGMLIGIMEMKLSPLKKIIIVREKLSNGMKGDDPDKVLFYLSTHRRIDVTRDDDGKVNKDIGAEIDDILSDFQ